MCRLNFLQLSQVFLPHSKILSACALSASFFDVDIGNIEYLQSFLGKFISRDRR